jgi:hypothetical protein
MRTWAVTNHSGWHVQPGSLLMKSLCNADNSPDDIDRSRYVIKMAPTFNAWDRCSGRPAESEDAEAGTIWP